MGILLRPIPTTLLLRLDTLGLNLLLELSSLLGSWLLGSWLLWWSSYWWRSLPGLHLVPKAEAVFDQTPQDPHVHLKSTLLICEQALYYWAGVLSYNRAEFAGQTPAFMKRPLCNEKAFTRKTSVLGWT